MTILSPLNGSSNIILEKEIPSAYLVDLYKKQLDIDVGKYFNGIKTLKLYKCLETGYRFYYPFNTDGDSAFYESLQKHSWYYMDWKWEHDITSKYIRSADSVLEVGCARGGFLAGIESLCAKSVGLELNVSAAETAVEKGLEVFRQTIKEHALLHPERYDMVCSFQVAEHISSISEYLQASLDTLKTGGLLVLSVPNNDSLIFLTNPDISLNMPPHHMGLWDVNSLIKLQEIFRMRLEVIKFEPLQEYHLGYALNVSDRVIKGLADKYGFMSPLIMKAIRRFSVPSVKSLLNYLSGHTLLAVFRKI